MPVLLSHLDPELVKAVVLASIRPGSTKKVIKNYERGGLKIIVQPKYNTPDYHLFIEDLKKLNVDLMLCYSYSMIIRKDILELVNYNAFNIHASLLPRNRGCNPTQWALIKGEKETGVTLHYVDDGLDSGDIVAQEKIDIDFTDTWLSVNTKKIPPKVDKVLKDNLPKILADKNIIRIKQDETMATSNKRLNQGYPRIDFDKMDDLQIYNLIRAQVAPLKGAFIERSGEMIYIDKLVPYEEIKKLRSTYSG